MRGCIKSAARNLAEVIKSLESKKSYYDFNQIDFICPIDTKYRLLTP